MARTMKVEDTTVFRLVLTYERTEEDGTKTTTTEVVGPYRTPAAARAARTSARYEDMRNAHLREIRGWEWSFRTLVSADVQGARVDWETIP